MAKKKGERINEAGLRRRMECSDAELRDHIRLACERSHKAIGLSTQLVVSTADQHAIVLHVIAFLIRQAACCIRDDDGVLARDSVAFTLENINLLLKGYEEDAARRN